MSNDHVRATTMMAAASPLASAVVQPRFQQIITSRDIVMDNAKRNPQAYSPAKLAAAITAPAEPQIGVTLFPPCNANPTVIVPEQPKQLKLMTAAVSLPEYFNWADAANVAATKKWPLRDPKLGPYTMTATNQETCGSCWAVSATSVLSDRWAIWTQGPNPQLSATYVLGCVSDGTVPNPKVRFNNTQGCNGGFPAAAAELFARFGVVNNECANYEWCAGSQACRSGPPDASTGGDPGGFFNKQLLPRCASSSGCLNCTCVQKGRDGKCISTKCTGKNNNTVQVFKVKRYTSVPRYEDAAVRAQVDSALPTPVMSAQFKAPRIDDTTSAAISLSNITDIKNEIFANGPVVGCYAVFYDFQSGSGARNCWAPTKGVYCNVQTGQARPYSRTSYGGAESQLTGYHAIAIVGWGVEKDVVDWANPTGPKLTLPYWICRNSWSTNWNSDCSVNDGKLRLPGFFKIAMTNTAKNINTLVYMDRVGGGLGGATAFQPDVARVNPKAGAKLVRADTETEGALYNCNPNVFSKSTVTVSASGIYGSEEEARSACGKRQAVSLTTLALGVLLFIIIVIVLACTCAKKK